ncbi:MAG TPA: toll/interleukin-1 receptor domain-containing protein [Thermoanaerobaculia bacterium]|nr:toll/interleukin-1 receptor domain-containing protein [Thermoanaerobaculia bacterium]
MPCIYQHDFFVSYPNMPKENILTEFVEELVKTIKFLRTGDKLPEPVYMDKERLMPGFRWKPELSRALCHSRAMLAVYTDDYFSRVYCLSEWDAMIDLELKRLGKPAHSMIIPVLLRAMEDNRGEPILPERMRELQYEDFRSILAPKQQFTSIKVRQKVERLLKRINDLRRQSQDPKVDCDSYEVVIPAAVLPPPQEAFGGGWAG